MNTKKSYSKSQQHPPKAQNTESIDASKIIESNTQEANTEEEEGYGGFPDDISLTHNLGCAR